MSDRKSPPPDAPEPRATEEKPPVRAGSKADLRRTASSPPRRVASGTMGAVAPGRSQPAPPASMRTAGAMPPMSRRDAPRVPLDFGLMTPAVRLVEDILRIASGERVLVAHDESYADFARAFEFAVVERGGRLERLDLEQEGTRPWTACPPAALAALTGISASLLAVRSDEAEQDARAQFVAAAAGARTRHVQIVGASRRALSASVSASPARVFDLIAAVRDAIRPTSRLTVRSRAGTQLEIECAPTLRWFTNGGVLRQGQCMTMPYGSLITSPASASGVYCADASMGGEMGARAGSLAPRAIRLQIENGSVRSVDCSDPVLRTHVERFVAEGHGRERVGLVVLGANVAISAAIGELQHDENAPGLHLALGETFPARTGASWTAQGQLAFAMADADVDLDGAPLIRQGRYVRFV